MKNKYRSCLTGFSYRIAVIPGPVPVKTGIVSGSQRMLKQVQQDNFGTFGSSYAKSLMYLCTAASFFLWLSPLLAYSSLLFTESEIRLIRQNILYYNKANNIQYLFLSGILYVDPNHWALWLNNTVIHPHSLLKIKGLHIKKVMPHRVEFMWNSLLFNKPITFTLRPHQLYLVKEKRVISK